MQATTLILDVDTNFNVNITYNVNLNFEIYSLNVKFVEAEESNFNVNTFLVKSELLVIVKLIKRKVATFFNRGHSFPDLLQDTPLCWLDITNVKFIPNYGDYFIWGGFTPQYNTKLCPLDQPYGDWTALLLEPK